MRRRCRRDGGRAAGVPGTCPAFIRIWIIHTAGPADAGDERQSLLFLSSCAWIGLSISVQQDSVPDDIRQVPVASCLPEYTVWHGRAEYPPASGGVCAGGPGGWRLYTGRRAPCKMVRPAGPAGDVRNAIPGAFCWSWHLPCRYRVKTAMPPVEGCRWKICFTCLRC